MKDVQEVFIQSLCNEDNLLWPSQVCHKVQHVYLFDDTWVVEKEQLEDKLRETNETMGNYLVIPVPEDEGLLKGVVNQKTGIALLNESIISDGDFSRAEFIRINSVELTEVNKPTLNFLKEKMETKSQLAKTKLHKARSYFDHIRKIHDSAMIEEKAQKLEEELLEFIFGHSKHHSRNGYADQSYFGTHGVGGPIYVSHFRSEVDQCFILKGQSSRMTSSILNSIAKTAQNYGFNRTLFYCPFYTEEIDGIILPEIKTAILDGEAPHQVEPLHPQDHVIFGEKRCSHQETLFGYAVELREAEAKYKQLMRQAILHLQEWRKLKRQELFITKKYKEWTITKLLDLLNGVRHSST